ncbi:MAG: alpha/beta fold hydrolase, partial [Alphaproteobacteria bacterium]
SEIGAHLLNMFAERGPRLKGDAIAQVFAAGNSTATTERLHEMKVPTLVINGEHDHSLQAGQRTANLIPNAEHKMLPGTGHACCIENPADFNQLVLSFLRAQGLIPELTA